MAGLPGKTVALGNPQSSIHQISQVELADWMTEVEGLNSLSGFAFVRGSAAALGGLGADGDYALVVTTAAERGIYQRSSGSWSKVADLPLILTESLAADQAEANRIIAETAAATASADAASASASAMAAASSQSLADVARTQAQLAAVASGATIYASVAAGEAGTVNGDVFLVATEPGVQVYENAAGTGSFLGWLGEALMDDFAAVIAWTPPAYPQTGLKLRTREEGFGYSVLASGATDADLTTAGGVKLLVLPSASGLSAEAFGFSASATGSANRAALQAANDKLAAAGGGVLTVRTHATIEGDFFLSSGVSFDAEGFDLTFNNGGFRIDGINAGAHVAYWSAKIQITRTGTAGPAIFLGGDDTSGSNEGAIRGRLFPIVKGSTGVGIEMANAYILDVFFPSVRNCAGEGWKFNYGPTDTTSANLINIFGGETQQCAGGYTTQGVSGIFWHGHGIEGNSTHCLIGENSRDIHHFGGYFELNATTGYDIVIGDANSSPVNVSFSGCVFYDGAGANKTHAIHLRKASGFSIRDCRGEGYTNGLVDYDPISGGVVTGTWNNLSGVAPTDAAKNRFFTPLDVSDRILTQALTWDIPNLAQGASDTTTVAVSGASVGDFVQVQRGSTHSTVLIHAEVSSAGIVQIRATNCGASAVDLGNATFRVIVNPLGWYF